MIRPTLFSMALSLALLAQPHAARAAVFCVNTSAELATALNAAGSNNADDVIQVKAGTYAGGSGAVAFAYASNQSFDITLSGGWVTLVAFDCGRQLNDPTATVLTGSNLRQVLRMQSNAGTTGTMAVENLTIRDGNNASEVGGGLELEASASTADLRVERVYFDGNVTETFGGGLWATTRGTIEVRNNLFLDNRAGASAGAAGFQGLATGTTAVRSFIGNNTVVAHGCSAGSPGCVSGFGVFGSARAALYNNAFAFNDGFDVALIGTSVDLFYNNINELSGTPVNSVGNQDLDNPGFVSVFGLDFRLTFASPLRNAGAAAFSIGEVDFDGAPRINDGRVDVGAFENDDICLKSGFESPQ